PPQGRRDWRISAVAKAVAGEPQCLAALAADSEGGQTGHAILAGLECVGERASREAFGEYEGLLLSPAAKQHLTQRYGEEHLWSASRLEMYAHCPYQFFSRQVLKLEPLEDLALRSDHLRRGGILHQVLAAL